MSTYDPQKLIEHYRRQAAKGLASAASDAQADMRGTRAHGDITGATRASYRAYVVGPGVDESRIVADAIGEVSSLNPGTEAIQDYGLPPSTLGVIITGFTSYLPDLQTDYAGRKAVLGPTLQAFSRRFVDAAAEGR